MNEKYVIDWARANADKLRTVRIYKFEGKCFATVADPNVHSANWTDIERFLDFEFDYAPGTVPEECWPMAIWAFVGKICEYLGYPPSEALSHPTDIYSVIHSIVVSEWARLERESTAAFVKYTKELIRLVHERLGVTPEQLLAEIAVEEILKS